MAEHTLNDPLTGEEIKAIVVQRIKNALDKDSNLLNDIAYAGFWAGFEVKLSFVRSLAAPTLAWGTVERKVYVDGPLEPHESAVVGEYKTETPDVSRQEHDLAIPVIAQTPSGPERRKVRIERAK